MVFWIGIPLPCQLIAMSAKLNSKLSSSNNVEHYSVCSTLKYKTLTYKCLSVCLSPGGVLNRYTGCAGAVKGLQCFPGPDGQALLASCGLDKYLRVYTLESPKLLHKVRGWCVVEVYSLCGVLRLMCGSVLWCSFTNHKLPIRLCCSVVQT